MWDPVIRWKEIILEGFSGVDACELVGFRGRVEELDSGSGVDREIVDGFEGLATAGGFELGEHGDEGILVEISCFFALQMEIVSLKSARLVCIEFGRGELSERLACAFS